MHSTSRPRRSRGALTLRFAALQSEEELPAVDYMARWDRAVMALSSSRPIKQKLLDLSAYASNHADFADVCVLRPDCFDATADAARHAHVPHTAVPGADPRSPLRVKEVELVAAGLPELHMLTIFGAHLMSLNLTNCSLSANGARALAYGLVENRTLKKLWLNGNPIGPEGVQHIAQALRHNEHLMSLNLASTSLERGPWLRNDEYDHMVFDSDYRGVEALADMLCANRTLTRLNVAKNHLRARGVELLVPALRAHVSLKSVSLAMNNINPSAFLYIGRIMLDNTVLFKLDVRGHNLQMRGCKLLCEGLRRNFSVQTLNVRNCGLTGEHMKVHLGPLLGNGTVRSFDASYNNLGSEGMTVMADVVEKSSMTSLDLSSVSATDNGVELAGALEFMERLATNRNLVDLALAHNNLVLFNFRAKDSRDDDYGAIDALSAALRTNRTLVRRCHARRANRSLTHTLPVPVRGVITLDQGRRERERHQGARAARASRRVGRAATRNPMGARHQGGTGRVD